MSRNLTIITVIFSILLALAILGGLMWGNTFYVRANPVEKQFLVPWLAAQTYIHYGISPYDNQTTQRAQIVYYGRLAKENEDPLRLSMPLPAELLYFPFALITDYILARGLWMMLSQIALVAAAFLCLSLAGWKPRGILLLVTLFFSILWVYAFKPLTGGSPAPFVALGMLGALAAMRAEKDELAGALLALFLLEPGIAAVFLLFVLWWTVTFRRGRVWWGFLMVAGFFTIVSFLLIPSWLMPFLRGVVSHFHYNPGLTVSSLLAGWWPALGPKLSLVMTAGLGGMLFLEWRGMRGKDFRHSLWVASLTLTAAPLIGLPVSLDAHLLLLLPLVLVLAVVPERWSGVRKTFASGCILAGVFSLLWLISSSVQSLFFVLPFLLLGGLYWMRWWAVHPPRTWAETLPK